MNSNRIKLFYNKKIISFKKLFLFQIQNFLFFGLGIGLVFIGSVSKSEPLSLFKKISTPFMVVQPWSDFSSQYPNGFQWLKSDLWKWNPDGKPLAYSRECFDELGLVQDRFYQDQNPEAWQNSIHKIFKDCDSVVQKSFQNTLLGMIQSLSIKLDLKSHPYVSSVLFHLPKGTRVGGLLALKGGDKPRPLLIFRMGVFSNAHEFFAERSFFIQWFEQSGFNVLLLESSTGTDYVDRNLNFEFGGLEEGLQNIYIAKKLQDPTQPISKYISEIHLAGISFGGQGVMVANYINDLQEKPIIKSTIGICPLIDLPATFEKIQAGWMESQITNLWTKGRLKSLVQRNGWQKRKDILPALLDQQEKKYKGVVGNDWPGIELPNFQFISYRTANDVKNWKLAQKTPLSILWTKNDLLVDPKINVRQIELAQSKAEDTNKLSTKPLEAAGPKADNGNSSNKNLNLNMNFFEFQQGQHCSLAASYDWQYMTRLLQMLVLRYSDYQPDRYEKFVSLETLNQAFSYIPFDVTDTKTEIFVDSLKFLPDRSVNIVFKQRIKKQGFWFVDWVREKYAKSFEVQWDLKKTDFYPLIQDPSSLDLDGYLTEWTEAEKNLWLRYFQHKLVIQPVPEKVGYLFTLRPF